MPVESEARLPADGIAWVYPNVCLVRLRSSWGFLLRDFRQGLQPEPAAMPAEAAEARAETVLGAFYEVLAGQPGQIGRETMGGLEAGFLGDLVDQVPASIGEGVENGLPEGAARPWHGFQLTGWLVCFQFAKTSFKTKSFVLNAREFCHRQVSAFTVFLEFVLT